MKSSSIILALSLVAVGITFGLSSNAYAQTSGLIPIGFKHMGEVSIDNVSVDEKEYYKIVHVKLYMKINGLALEDGDSLNGAILLQNANGKTYGGTLCDYQNPLEASHFTETSFVGTQGGINKPTFCYNVEKEFNQLTVYLQQYSNSDASYHKYLIGNIDLTQTSSSSSSDSGSSPSSLSDSNPSSSNSATASGSSSTNIFDQLMNFLKQIFHFMVLGSSFLNDS